MKHIHYIPLTVFTAKPGLAECFYICSSIGSTSDDKNPSKIARLCVSIGIVELDRVLLAKSLKSSADVMFITVPKYAA